METGFKFFFHLILRCVGTCYLWRPEPYLESALDDCQAEAPGETMRRHKHKTDTYGMPRLSEGTLNFDL